MGGGCGLLGGTSGAGLGCVIEGMVRDWSCVWVCSVGTRLLFGDCGNHYVESSSYVQGVTFWMDYILGIR